MKTRTKVALGLGAAAGLVAVASRAANRSAADRIRAVTDPDLDPLRKRDDFQKLLVELTSRR